MAMVIKNNLESIRVLNQLNQNNSELSKRLAKVSSGMKINSAQDDASGYAISERMRVQIRSLNQDSQNVQNGTAMLRTAERGVQDIVDALRTMKERAINAANDSNTDEDRATIQKELTQLIDSINDVALGNEYNGKRLLNGIYDAKYEYSDGMDSALQVAKAMMSSLDETTLKGNDALDEAINAGTSGKFTTRDELISKFMSDLENASSYQDFLKDSCDIILGNDDTGAITGSDAGGDTTKTAETIVPEQNFSNWVTPTPGTTTTINGLTVHWPTNGVGTGLTDKEKHILAGLNSDWIEQSVKLVGESFGINFNEPGTTVKDISVTFENNSTNHRLAAVGSTISSGITTGLELIVNMYYYNNVNTASEDGALSSSNQTYLDRTIAHEFTHAIMSANINNFGDLPMYLVEGTAELVHGIDDERWITILSFGENLKKNSSGVYLVNPDRSPIVESHKDISDVKAAFNAVFEHAKGGATGTSEPYAAGYILLRYMGKQGQGGGDSILTTNRKVKSMRNNPLVIQHGTQAGQHSNFYIKDMQTKSLTAGKIFKSGADSFSSEKDLISENDRARYKALDYDPDKQAEFIETLKAASNMTIDDISVRTIKDANIAIRVLDGALEYSLDNATTLGAYLERLEYTDTNIITMAENITASESTIRDADMAKEMTAYTKANVLLQAAQSMLAQANQSPNAVLGLLQ